MFKYYLEQKANYMQALVVCSVNCHMNTACPLAFSEIGVKERVKSVMNYKKPAFGIIILAVIVCVIVAVCFLTNPKQNSFIVPTESREPSVYSDVGDMNFAEFMTYFPKDGSTVDEAEFAILKEQEDFLFYDEVSTLADMPVPIHKYPVRIINLMLKEYAGIAVDDLDTSEVHYLPEYDSFYNYTSDMGYGTFICTRGEVDGDIVRLYEESDYSTDVLTLKKEGNSYHILSHLQLENN